MTPVVVALVAIILIKIVIEILDNKGDLVVALVAIILIKKWHGNFVGQRFTISMEFTIV